MHARDIYKRFTILACLVAWATTVAAQTETTAPKETSALETQWRIIKDEWFTLEFGGGRAGWMNEIKQTDGEQLRSSVKMQMKIGRGGIPIEIATSSMFTETADGKPLQVEMNQKMSQQETQTKWVFHDDYVSEITMQGGRRNAKRKQLPVGEWLTPAAAERYAKKQRQAGAKEFSYRALDPSNGMEPVNITSKFVDHAQIELGGRQVQVEVWNVMTKIKGLLGETEIAGVEKLDAKGDTVYGEISLMGMGKLITRLSTKEEALGGLDGEVPELMLQTFVKPDRPIDRPMQTVKSKLRLRLKEGKMPVIPAAGAQRVEIAQDGKSVMLSIDINDNLPASSEEMADEEYRASSSMVDIDDELVQKLSKQAVREEGGDAMNRAEALRAFVRKHISKKGMQTAFASASETARMKTGDCSEHGVLLCALLRAQGIPARVATGLIYADSFADHDDIFGWHMWTQALIDGKWIDFDATIRRRYNATHVLTGTSSLKDGMGAGDLAPMLHLIGNLEIEVLEVAHE